MAPLRGREAPPDLRKAGRQAKQLTALEIEAAKPFPADNYGPAFGQGVTRAKEMPENLEKRWGTVGKTGRSVFKRIGGQATQRPIGGPANLEVEQPVPQLLMPCA
jgi:hypothetical protein